MRFLSELRLALRTLARSPGFFALAATTLALGIGAATVVFSVANSVLWRLLPFPDSERLVQISERNPSRPWQSGVTAPNFLDWRNRVRSFASVALRDWGSAHNFTGPESTERVRVDAVSSGFFETLGVAPALGRSFRVEEEQPGKNRIAILGYELWKRQFHADPGAVGALIKLEDEAYLVVAVLPATFRLDFERDPDLYVPLTFSRENLDRSSKVLAAIGRLNRGTTLMQAGAEMDAIAGELALQHPDTNGNSGAAVQNLRESYTKFSQDRLQIFLGFGGLVLLIACANVTSLLLVRLAGRQRECAVRMALGANRTALLRGAIAENFWIALPGGTAGAILAAWGVEGVRKFLPPDTFPRSADISMDVTALLFALGVAALTTLAFAIAPALLASRLDTDTALRDGSKSVTDSPRLRRRIGILIATELTLAFVMLFGAGLFISSYRRLERVPLGFVRQNLVTMRVLPGAHANTLAFYSHALETVGNIPGIHPVALASGLPLVGAGIVYFERADRPALVRGKEPDSLVRVVSPDYFRVLGTQLLRGRAFNPQDSASAPRVAIVNETLAARWFPGEDSIGKELAILRGGDSTVATGKVRIVGLASNIKEGGLDEVVFNDIYLPFAQNPSKSMYILAKTDGKAESFIPPVRQALQALDREEAVYNVATMEDRVGDSLRGARFNLTWISLFAALSVLLASVGVYGAIALSVAQRRREFGLRMALGAHPRAILKLALVETARLGFTAIACGVLLALALGQLLKSALYLAPGKHVGMIYAVSLHDPASLAAATVLMLALAAMSAVGPARRASRTDPLVVLRHQ